MKDPAENADRPSPSIDVDVLVDNHRRFLSFLETRLGSASAAEDILQSAYVRAVEKGIPAEDSEGAVNWFFAVLRNALTDHFRRRAAQKRSQDALAAEGLPTIADPELRAEVCACFRRLLPTMRDEYAAILEKVDLEERAVSDVAQEIGITTNNASVRLHRARAALRRQLERSCGACATHGCLDCSCRNEARLEYRDTPSPSRRRP